MFADQFFLKQNDYLENKDKCALNSLKLHMNKSSYTGCQQRKWLWISPIHSMSRDGIADHRTRAGLTPVII